ncbi:hypothetical protein KA005_21195, partial [bacterium]|nr:hypothetical protein [bacterium]
METKKRTVLLGLSIALVFLVFMTSGVNAQENTKADLCRQIIEAACIDTGGIAGCVFHLPGSTTDWWVVSSSSHSYGVRIYYDDNSTTLQGWSNTSDTFHGHKANYIIDRDSTAKHGGAQFEWLIDSCIFHVHFSYSSSWNTINSLESAEKEIFEMAEIMYKYIEEFGLVEPPNCLTATGVQNVKVIYPDGTEKICREPTLIELEEGMIFKALSSEKNKLKAMYKASEASDSEIPIIKLPNKMLYDLEEIRIKNLKTTDDSSDITYSAKMADTGMVWSDPNEPMSDIPADMAFLMDVFEVRTTTSRLDLYTTLVIKEGIEMAVIFVASQYTPWYIPAYIYDRYDTAGEVSRGVNHIRGPCEDTDSEFMPAPRGYCGTIVTPSGKVIHHSGGLIGITNNTTEVYVFEGEFQLSDLNETKTVTVYANQTSSCELGSIPTDPVPFDQSSVDKLWETVHET